MPFSLFTTRKRQLSTRLRLLAGGFQLTGVFALTLVAFGAIVLPMFDGPVTMYRWMFPRMVVLGTLTAASLFLIGRALRRRQRWGAYLAGFTLGVPLIRQLLRPDAAILSLPEILVSTAALIATVTVWDELQTVRDSDFDSGEEDDDDDPVVPQRNRGYGESRTMSAPYSAATNVGGAVEPHAEGRLLIEPKPTAIRSDARTPDPISSPLAD